MRKLIVNEFLTLDGNAQAGGGPDEDTSGGFQHGGWHVPYGTEDGMEKLVGDAGGFLLGRRTYELFAGFWPNAPEDAQEFAEPMNTKPKYVASRTLTGPLEWQNSALLPEPVPEAVAALKEEDGAYLLGIGSTVLVQSLIQHGLVDELRLLIDRYWSAAGSGSSRTTARFGRCGSSITGWRAPARSSRRTRLLDIFQYRNILRTWPGLPRRRTSSTRSPRRTAARSSTR